MTKLPPSSNAWCTDFPEELSARYDSKRKGKKYANKEFHLARFPFLVNDVVDDAPALVHLRYLPVNQNDVFAGVAGLRSLDLLVNIGATSGNKYDKAILFDGNLTQIKAMNAVLWMIENAKTPDDFIEHFVPHHVSWTSRVPRASSRGNPSLPHTKQTDEDKSYFAIHGTAVVPHTEKELRHYLNTQKANIESWLYPDNFEHIKRMVKGDRIQTSILRLDDPKRIEVLHDWLAEKNLHVRDLYLSSIPGFARDHFMSDYYSQFPDKPLLPRIENGIDKMTDSHARILSSEPVGVDSGFVPAKRFRLHIQEKQQALDKLRDVKNMGFILDHNFSVGRLSIMLRVDNPNAGVTGVEAYLSLLNAPVLTQRQYNQVMAAMDKVVARIDRDGTAQIDPFYLAGNHSTTTFIIPITGKDQWKGTMNKIQALLTEELSPILNNEKRM